ncbi:MAG: hypothetical protein NVS2B16_22140 [Chloroflexota bacterium]
MGNDVRRQTFWAQNRWALPLLLALIIVAIVLAVTLGPKLKSSSAAATATPATQKIVVTATPGASTPTAATNATPGANGAPTATPANGQGASTPLPNATPIPTEQGKVLGQITRPMTRVTAIQKGADAGNAQYTFYLDPRQVVLNTLPDYGFAKGSFQITSPAPSPTPTPFAQQDGRPLVYFVISYQGRQYQVRVAQPGAKGPKGIWVIVTILPHGYY